MSDIILLNDREYNVVFHGNLEQYSAKPLKIYAKDLRDIFSNLCVRFGESFKETILNGAWHIMKGDVKEENYVSTEEVELPLLTNTIHIFPAISGSGGTFGKIIFGVVLIVAAFVTGFAAFGAAALAAAATGGTVGIGAAFTGLSVGLGLAGISSLASGVMGMLTKTPSVQVSSGAGRKKESFIFNGAVNNSEEGTPIPRVYGTHLAGSVVISAGLDTERL